MSEKFFLMSMCFSCRSSMTPFIDSAHLKVSMLESHSMAADRSLIQLSSSHNQPMQSFQTLEVLGVQ